MKAFSSSQARILSTSMPGGMMGSGRAMMPGGSGDHDDDEGNR
ncbi:hypothetical protein [Microvirga terrestris]|nr:hypothetical protein [Microvirga terrestris]